MNSVLRIGSVVLWLVTMLSSMPVGAQGAAGSTTPAQEPIINVPNDLVARLLDPEVSEKERSGALAEVETLALQNSPEAQFVLGMLYRWGMEHPAKLVERDRTKADAYLSQAASRGNLSSMAAMAELELDGGSPKAAVVWAVLSLHYEKISWELFDPKKRYSANVYEVDLLSRCKKAVGEEFDEGITANDASQFVARFDSRIRHALTATSIRDKQPMLTPVKSYQDPAPPRYGAAVGEFLLGVDPEGRVVKTLPVGFWPNMAAADFMPDWSRAMTGPKEAEAESLRWAYIRYSANPRR